MHLKSIPLLLTLFLGLVALPVKANPMCEKGEFRILSKGKQTIRSYNGELCKIVPIAFWVRHNCQDQPDFKSSQCNKNADFAFKNMTSDQKRLYNIKGGFRADNIAIENPQGISDLMEMAKKNKGLSPNDIKIWERYKRFFPKPGSMPPLDEIKPNSDKLELIPSNSEPEKEYQPTPSPTMTVNTAFEIMGLEAQTATPAKLQSQYKKMALVSHPDRGGNEEDFKKINEANEVLKKYFEKRQERVSNPPPPEDTLFPPGHPSSVPPKDFVPLPNVIDSGLTTGDSPSSSELKSGSSTESNTFLDAKKALKKTETKESIIPGLGQVKE